jgi:hypothetical protein
MLTNYEQWAPAVEYDSALARQTRLLTQEINTACEEEPENIKLKRLRAAANALRLLAHSTDADALTTNFAGAFMNAAHACGEKWAAACLVVLNTKS